MRPYSNLPTLGDAARDAKLQKEHTFGHPWEAAQDVQFRGTRFSAGKHGSKGGSVRNRV